MRVAVFDDMNLCTPAEVERMLPLVSAQRYEQALRYKHTLGQFCCLKSWLMLQEILDEGMKELMNEWSYNEHGKPSFTHSLIHSFTPYFSISHCQQGIAVAIDERPIGIDIEAIRHADESLIERTMNAAERAQITDDRDFTRLWTQKEAILKMLGTGIESFEQLQNVLLHHQEVELSTYDQEKYIYSIAYGK